MLGKHRYTEHANKFHKRLRLDIDSIGSDLLVSARETENECVVMKLFFFRHRHRPHRRRRGCCCCRYR